MCMDDKSWSMGRNMLYCGGTSAHAIKTLRLMFVIAASSSWVDDAGWFVAMTLAYFWLSGEVGSQVRC